MVTNKHNFYLTSVASVHEVFTDKGSGTQVLLMRTQAEGMLKFHFTQSGPSRARSVARRHRHKCEA